MRPTECYSQLVRRSTKIAKQYLGTESRFKIHLSSSIKPKQRLPISIRLDVPSNWAGKFKIKVIAGDSEVILNARDKQQFRYVEQMRRYLWHALD
jgi:hypothetical protein